MYEGGACHVLVYDEYIAGTVALTFGASLQQRDSPWWWLQDHVFFFPSSSFFLPCLGHALEVEAGIPEEHRESL